MTSAPIWIVLAVAVAARDGCGSDAPPATGSAGSAVATPTLAPTAAGSAGSAAPTTTTMSRDAQAKLDKLVGAKPGTHQPIKPTPEPAAGGSGSATAKPAKKKNPFPRDGREMSEDEMFSYPDMDRDKESYDFGAAVREGFSGVPRYVVYRCVNKPTCRGWAYMSDTEWKPIGWYGAEF